MHGDQAEARTCNVDLTKPHIHMLGNGQNVRAREVRLKRPIVADLSENGITEKHRRKSMDDHLTFEDKEADQDPYPKVLVISVPIAEVNIPKILVDTESTLNILYTSTLKWMGIPIYFLQPYSNMVLGLNGAGKSIDQAHSRSRRNHAMG